MADKYEQIQKIDSLMVCSDNYDYQPFQILGNSDYLDSDYRFRRLDAADSIEKTFAAIENNQHIAVHGQFMEIDKKTEQLRFEGFSELITKQEQ